MRYTKLFFVLLASVFLISGIDKNELRQIILDSIVLNDGLNNSNNFSDLDSALFDALKKRVIVLGELSHGDSVACATKLRIIKYLHEKHNYNVLIEELPLISINSLQKHNKDSLVENYPFFVSQFFYENQYGVLKYVEKCGMSNNPLLYRGLDVGIDSSFLKRCELFIKEINPNILKSNDWLILYRIMDNLFNNKKYNEQFNEKEHHEFVTSIKNIQKVISQSDTSFKAKTYLLELHNLQGYISYKYKNRAKKIKDNKAKYFEDRDKLMAENLIWYANECFPNQKIIISVSNYHAARNTCLLKDRKQKEVKPMLDIAKDSLNNNFYSIAFAKYSGIQAFVFAEDVKLRSKKSLEFGIHEISEKTRFINLKRTPDNKKIYSYIFADKLLNAPNYWKDIYDGLIYIDKERPNIYVFISDEIKKGIFYEDRNLRW